MPLLGGMCPAFRTFGSVPKNSQREHFVHKHAVHRFTTATMPRPSKKNSVSLADSLRRILATSNLSLADISRASRRRENDLTHIPYNFYSSLRRPSFSPSLGQLDSLSRLSGYRLVDWLSLFSFSLDDVSRFQARFIALRTVRLDMRTYQPRSSIPWFRDLREADLASPLIPLSQWLAAAGDRSVETLPRGATEDYLYVKIGLEDAFAFPDLLPGSIVRINRNANTLKQLPAELSSNGPVYLVEHERGLICARLLRSGPKMLVLCSRQLPYAAVELQEGSQARILGIAEIEIRPTRNPQVPIVPPALGRFWTPAPLSSSSAAENFGQFLRECRGKSGLSFRQASDRTVMVADELEDRRYYCSPGALSDYETRRLPPRHIHKLISIAAAYFVNVTALFAHSHAGLGRGPNEPMPDRFLEFSATSSDTRSQFLKQMSARFGDLPYFLRCLLFSAFPMSRSAMSFGLAVLRAPLIRIRPARNFLSSIVSRRRLALRSRLHSGRNRPTSCSGATAVTPGDSASSKGTP